MTLNVMAPHARLPLLLTAALAGTAAAEVAQRFPVYRDGGVAGHRVAVWGMAHASRRGGATPDGKHLWLNADWKARPWAGMTVKGGPKVRLTREWIEKGFVRFLLNASVTRYDQPAGTLDLQVKLDGPGGTYQPVRTQHIDRGRGAPAVQTLQVNR